MVRDISIKTPVAASILPHRARDVVDPPRRTAPRCEDIRLTGSSPIGGVIGLEGKSTLILFRSIPGAIPRTGTRIGTPAPSLPSFQCMVSSQTGMEASWHESPHALLLTTLLGAFCPSSLLGQEAKRRSSKPRTREIVGSSRRRRRRRRTPTAADDAVADASPRATTRRPASATSRASSGSATDRPLHQGRQNSRQPAESHHRLDLQAHRHARLARRQDRRPLGQPDRAPGLQLPEILKQVDEIVERFTNATEDVLSIHVQFIAAVDTRWRYSVFSRLTFVGSGPQGQQIWTMRLEDAALILSQMQVQQGFRKLADQRVEMINGQTLTIKTSEPRTFAGGLQRDGAAGTGFQPKADKLEESIILKLSPLLNFDGDAVDAMIDLTVNTVRSFHRTRVITPRDERPARDVDRRPRGRPRPTSTRPSRTGRWARPCSSPAASIPASSTRRGAGSTSASPARTPPAPRSSSSSTPRP